MSATLFQHLAGYFAILTVAFFAIFLWAWLTEPRRLVNGVLFSIFFGSFLVELALIIFAIGNEVFTVTMGVIFVILVVLLLLTLAFSWVLLFWNAAIVWRRESHSLANMLTLLLAVALLGVWIWNLARPDRFLPEWLNLVLTTVPMLGGYLVLCSYNFLVNLFLYQFFPKGKQSDYLIVLGAGLINGQQVSRLLGNRIDRALAFANRQITKGYPAPTIIFSGGQGHDEKLSEALAMATYAIEHGWDSKLILLEDKSTNTLENMAFSKKLINKVSTEARPRVKFFSNNYHIFRAGLYARMAGLDANGVGAKTRFYFMPNAFIREFIAVFLMNKKRHLRIIAVIILVFGILLPLASGFNGF